MKRIIFICMAAALFLIGCSSVIDIARYQHNSDKMAYNYIFSDAIIANEYITKVVNALDTNDREALAGLFPEHARERIDNFDEKIDAVFENYKYYSGSIIRYKLNYDNNYESKSDRGKVQKVVYADTAIEFAGNDEEYSFTDFPIVIYMEIIPQDDFHENNVGIAEFAIDFANLANLSSKLDVEKDGYDIYPFGNWNYGDE